MTPRRHSSRPRHYAAPNAPNTKAARLLYGRATNRDWLERADLRTLGETWAAAQPHADSDPNAAAAMTAVEDRFWDLQPGPMAYYDNLRTHGIHPRDAMYKAILRMNPATPDTPTPPNSARPHPGKTPLHAGPATGGALVPTNRPQPQPLTPEHAQALKQLESIYQFLQLATAAGPTDPYHRQQTATTRIEIWRTITELRNSPPPPNTRAVEGLRSNVQVASKAYPTAPNPTGNTNHATATRPVTAPAHRTRRTPTR